ncbi:MAG TPA: hypothetical protein VGV68_13120 [Terriglobia bacterium]|nr:hypothetical protein [Terriglobia bacterium]
MSQSDPELGYERREEWARKSFRELAWTNLFKIGWAGGGNPGAEMRSFLRSFGFLLDEIKKVIKPSVVVFSTGRNYDPYLREALGEGIVIEPDPVEPYIGKISGGFGCRGYRTPHFQRLTNAELYRLCSLLCGA